MVSTVAAAQTKEKVFAIWHFSGIHPTTALWTHVKSCQHLSQDFQRYFRWAFRFTWLWRQSTCSETDLKCLVCSTWGWSLFPCLQNGKCEQWMGDWENMYSSLMQNKMKPGLIAAHHEDAPQKSLSNSKRSKKTFIVHHLSISIAFDPVLHTSHVFATVFLPSLSPPSREL